LNVLAVDPKTGKEFFRFSFGKPGPTVNAAPTSASELPSV